MARLLFSLLAFFLFSARPASAEPAFAIPDPAATIAAPRDHGAHTNFKTEWWYLTASFAADGREIFSDGTDFGLQLTFFRSAMTPGGSDWNQRYLAHAAVTDRRSGRFLFEKRYVRGGLGVSQISTARLSVRQGDWLLSDEEIQFEVISAGGGRASVRLTVDSLPEIVRQGAGGYSKKGNCADCASHYYSIPRIALSGTIETGGRRAAIRGLGWLDHEWMSGAIDPAQVGWDWFGLMLKDGRSVMAFQLRDAAGAPNFGGATVIQGGVAHPLGAAEFSITPRGIWKSPTTGGLYPNSWAVVVPAFGIDLSLAPILADQELTGEGQQYWEGAVRSNDSNAVGYAELTGYVKPVGTL